MKFQIFVVASFVAYVLAGECTQRVWRDYKKEFNKTYKSMQDELMHFDTFCDTFYIVEEHNAVFRRGEVPYQKKFDKFSDMTSEEVAEYLKKHGNKRKRGSRRRVLKQDAQKQQESSANE